jgi:predicted acetyltransferase
MTSDVVTPGDEHRDEIVALMRVAYNLGAGASAERAAWLPVEKIRCVLDGDRIVAGAGARDFRQWFGGRQLEMSGIWGVATLPEHRGRGLATRAVTHLLEEARSKGQALSVLYPATQRPYRGMGYELAGTMTRHAVAVEDLPRGSAGPLAVKEYDASSDLEDVRACYRRSISGHQGPIDSDEPDWWPNRVLGRWFSDDVQRAVVVRGSDGIEGYASFTYGSDPGGPLEFEYTINCRHLVATSVEAWASLLSYLRGFRGLGRTLKFTGPPAGSPMALLIEEQRVRPAWSFQWMLRLLDVRAALEGRGYPPVSGSLVIAVEDGLFPDNRGPWRVEADGSGSVSVTAASGGSGDDRMRPVSIGALSSLYSGFLSAEEAMGLGLVDGDLAPGLARLFGGPAPWMHDFF